MTSEPQPSPLVASAQRALAALAVKAPLKRHEWPGEQELSIRLPASIIQELHDRASATGSTVSTLIIEALAGGSSEDAPYSTAARVAWDAAYWEHYRAQRDGDGRAG